MFKILSCLFFISLMSQSIACDENGTTGILPDNDLYIPVNADKFTNVPEVVFNQVLDRIESIYTPIVSSKGGNLIIERKWDDGTVNAYAQRQGDDWLISMFGGLARHDTVSADGFALVACHELGHHIGGAPKRRGWFGGSSWASNEGQSDYFGNLKCMREYFELDNNVELISEMVIHPLVTAKCEAIFADEEEAAICMRGAMAGQSLANLFASLRSGQAPAAFDTPDTTVASSTSDKHPAPQCRLDTYFHAALCDVDKKVDVSNSNAKVGTCNRSDNYTDGVRPLCWFKPN